MKNFVKYLILGCIGGVLYGSIEMLFRGRTHWSMLILGALCFIIVGLINEFFSWKTPILLQMLISAVIITILEFITGLIVNIWLDWNVWDYSNQWGNLLGQICPLFSALWFLISLPAIVLDDYLRYYILSEEKPQYKLF